MRLSAKSSATAATRLAEPDDDLGAGGRPMGKCASATCSGRCSIGRARRPAASGGRRLLATGQRDDQLCPSRVDAASGRAMGQLSRRLRSISDSAGSPSRSSIRVPS